MFQDAKNFVKRSIKKLEYKNIHFPEGYETAVEEYRKLRDELDTISAMVRSLSHYEFGGTYSKQIMSLTNAVASKSKISALRREDIYADAGIVGAHIASVAKSVTLKELCGSFSKAFTQIGEAKVRMNAKMQEAQTAVSELRRKAKEIDEKRKKLGVLRYDLEEAAQGGRGMDPRMQGEYNILADGVFEDIKGFIGDRGIEGLMRQIARAYGDFSEAGADSLEKIK